MNVAFAVASLTTAVLVTFHLIFPAYFDAASPLYMLVILSAATILPLSVIGFAVWTRKKYLNLLLLPSIVLLCVFYAFVRTTTEYQDPLKMFGRSPIYWVGGFSCYPVFAMDLIAFDESEERYVCILLAAFMLIVFTFMTYWVVNAESWKAVQAFVICYILSTLLNAISFAFVGAILL